MKECRDTRGFSFQRNPREKNDVLHPEKQASVDEVISSDQNNFACVAYLLNPPVTSKLRLIRVENHFVYTGVVNADLQENEDS